MRDGEDINNAGSDPDSEPRRTGGSPNDPHGGHERADEWRGPEPDPIDELVPGGTGSLPGTTYSVSENPYGSAQLDQLPHGPRDGDDVGSQPPKERVMAGFGPTEFDRPLLEGNADMAIQPRDDGEE